MLSRFGAGFALVKGFDDFVRPIPARKGCQLRRSLPAPIGGLVHIHVDRGAKGMVAQPFRPGDFSPVKGAGQPFDIDAEPWLLREDFRQVGRDGPERFGGAAAGVKFTLCPQNSTDTQLRATADSDSP